MQNIKQLIKSGIYILILIIFNNVTRKILKKIKFLGNFLYSNYIKTQLKSLDDNFLFEYPVILKGGKYIEIGKGFSSRSQFRIEAWDEFHGHQYTPHIKMGDNVIFNFNCHIGAINYIEIGNNVLIGSNVLLTDHAHGDVNKEALFQIPSERPLRSKGPIIIEDNVWIGEGVAILGNVKIGKNSIIGANSVVTKSVPANCVVGGIPAKIIKQF